MVLDLQKNVVNDTKKENIFKALNNFTTETRKKNKMKFFVLNCFKF